MSNAPNHHYRSALALNNMAVILLQEGCYEPALRTLSDSLTLMQRAFATTQVTKRRSKHGDDVDVFDKAAKRYYRAVKRTSKSVLSVTIAAEVRPLGDNDIPELRAAVNYGPSSSVVFLVRISGFPCCETIDVEAQKITKHLGIILYNQAMAHFLFFSQTKGQKKNA